MGIRSRTIRELTFGNPDALTSAHKDRSFDDDDENERFNFEENGNRNKRVLNEKERVDVHAISLSLTHAKTADDVEKQLKDLDILPFPVYSS